MLNDQVKIKWWLTVFVFAIACGDLEPNGSATETGCPEVLSAGNSHDGMPCSSADPTITFSSDTEDGTEETCPNGKIDEGEECDPWMMEPEDKTSPEYKTYQLSKSGHCKNDCRLDARLVFLTSKAVTFGPDGSDNMGDDTEPVKLNGIQAAHELCNTLAKDSGIKAVENRQFMAWLGYYDFEDTSKRDPCRCFNPSVYNLESVEPVNFIRVDGELIAPDWLTILGEKEDPQKMGKFLPLTSPIQVDEKGKKWDGANLLAWSNVSHGQAGTPNGSNMDDETISPSCQEWTWYSLDPLHGGRVGTAYTTEDHKWSYLGFDVELMPCDSDKIHLYCFEQCNSQEGDCFLSEEDFCFNNNVDICPKKTPG